jgi:hypothetical protein
MEGTMRLSVLVVLIVIALALAVGQLIDSKGVGKGNWAVLLITIALLILSVAPIPLK